MKTSPPSPVRLNDIEKLVGQGGLLQKLPPVPEKDVKNQVQRR